MKDLYLIDENLLRETVMLACNDSALVEKFKEKQIKLDEIARLASYASLRNLHQRNFDLLFYNPQLEALVESLKEQTVFGENQ